MNEYKITLSDGDYFCTRFNGTLEEAERYYLDHVFNTGTERDHLVKCVSIEQLNQ